MHFDPALAAQAAFREAEAEYTCRRRLGETCQTDVQCSVSMEAIP